MTAALACVALAGARIAVNLSLRAPLQLVTSGAEQEALDSIWRFAHGQRVYTNPHAIPYTASCFNWLFYAFYGSVTGAALRVLHLNDVWLPTVCRFFTLCLAVLGAFIFTRTMRSVGIPGHILIALAILAFFNPLCGFWIITARPDIGAVLLELVGVAFFFRYLHDDRFRWIILVALALYAAWAFKQSSLDALAGIALTLLLLRRGRALFLLGGLWLGGVIATAAWLGPDYRQQLYFGQLHSGFNGWWALGHLGLALLKMPLIAVALGGVAFFWKQPRPDPIYRAIGLILVFSLALDCATSTKAGAGDYYFIPLGVWSALWVGFHLAESRRAAVELPATNAGRLDDLFVGDHTSGQVRSSLEGRWLVGTALACACVLILIEVAAVFMGCAGTLDCRDPRQPYEHLARYLATQSGPVFVEDSYGDLPWISPTSPHFVVAFNNEPDQRAGVKFERGGWQRLMAEGYFSTVVTEARSSETSAAMLTHYRFVRGEAGWRYFERK